MNLLAAVLVVALCSQVSPQALPNNADAEDTPFEVGSD